MENAKLTYEVLPSGYESHMKIGDLKKALELLPDDGYVGLGLVDQPGRLPAFRFVAVDTEDGFLWLMIDASRSKQE